MEIEKPDHVEAKTELSAALKEKERREAEPLREAAEKHAMLERQRQRAVANESISSEELDSLLKDYMDKPDVRGIGDRPIHRRSLEKTGFFFLPLRQGAPLGDAPRPVVDRHCRPLILC